MDRASYIASGKAVLGIEFGSTRIKAVLIGEDHAPLASGGFTWENRLENGVWTYHMDEVFDGLRACYADLVKDIEEKFAVVPTKYAAIGISAMMHGYLAFDKEYSLLTPFRTWRNTMTGEAVEKLVKLFNFNVAQRFSISHLYQAILNKEAHVKDIDFLTTLAGYVHFKLTGERVLGIDDASGMFPIDSNKLSYNTEMLSKFDALLPEYNINWKLESILPKPLAAGEFAGLLTEEGARILDPSGKLEAGIPLCPPEGDAGTGMVATNSVSVRTGNVSAGTSVFAMAVLEHGLSKVHPEIDMVTTPSGEPVAMVHCNNCTSDINAWTGLFAEVLGLMGNDADMSKLFPALFNKAMEGAPDCGGLLSYNYESGEHVTGFTEGRPLFARKPDSEFSLANFMRLLLSSALASLKIGMDILVKEENVKIDCLFGHGGYFKTKGVGQRIMAAAMDAPVAVMETAGEGGAWGAALLAEYLVNKDKANSLSDYLSNIVFNGDKGFIIEPNKDDVKGFAEFIENYKAGLPIERSAIDAMR